MHLLKHVFWMLKRTFSVRRFYWVPKIISLGSAIRKKYMLIISGQPDQRLGYSLIGGHDMLTYNMQIINILACLCS